jgi:hypothetical protein
MSFVSGESHESGSGRERLGDARRVDGNAAGGMFSEIFVPDLTTAQAKCAGCGAVGMIGALPVYGHGMGTVVRCPKCDRVVLRVARTPTHVWLDATGATSIVISRGA